MIAPLKVWDDSYHKLPRNTNWARHVAQWYAKHAKLEPMILKGDFQFDFNQGVFSNRLNSLKAVFSAPEGARQFSDAWITSIKASKIMLAPGAFIGSPSPSSTFSQVEVKWSEPMLQAAKMRLFADIQRMKVPHALYNASQQLGIDALGMDSSSPVNVPLQAISQKVA
jgi:hypothetical protein